MGIQLPEGIFERIMCRIQDEQRLLTIRRRLAIFSFGIIGSMAAFIPVSKMLYAGFSESGFIEFFSLLFSDTGIVMTYWQSFAMSLLETTPVTGLIIFSFTLLVFLWSFKLLAENLKVIFNAKQLKLINNN